ncbi:pituitary tumor-transforming gene 1 [Lynx pardinus]|uniref:Pituitary tumor-transforming gene 1 n=1 Tax=Lynx pardinus TaxID=191816 RepID=A0A485MU65_LYNPA|nr:pituitary tumor-transforming gene 1 [Lynx pardinus]
MAFGGPRGLVPRWELPVGVAALLLLLFSVTAAQEPSVAACSQNTNRTCEECLKNVSCLWCNTNKACLDYPVTRILPPSSLCTLSSARWGVCWGACLRLVRHAYRLPVSLLLGALCPLCCRGRLGSLCCCRRARGRPPTHSRWAHAEQRDGGLIAFQEGLLQATGALACPTSLPGPGVICPLHFRPSGGFEVASHCGFDLLFPHDR